MMTIQSYTQLKAEFDSLIHAIPNVPELEIEETFMDISGFPNNENVVSNIYAFFLDASRSHGMERVFIHALCKLIQREDLATAEYDVRREYCTDEGRIDLLLHETRRDSAVPAKAIFIENKIYHFLNNNLIEYESFLKKENYDVIGVVLSLKREKVADHFYSITHEQLLNEVMRELGHSFYRLKPKYMIFLQDFIYHMISFTTTMTETQHNESLQYLFENREKIQKLMELQRNAVDDLKIILMKSIDRNEWEQSGSGSTISLKRPNQSLYMYIYFDKLFLEGQLLFELYIKGNQATIRNWNNTDYSAAVLAIAKKYNFDLVGDMSNGKQWVQTATFKMNQIVSKDVNDFLEHFQKTMRQLTELTVALEDNFTL